MWDKLHGLGVSAKITRILKNLYDKATVKIRASEGTTNEMKITEGLLQGEILGPLLFILFCADLEDYLR